MNNVSLNNLNFAQIQKLKVYGKVILSGQNVGGTVGYLGKTVYLKDAWFCVQADQKISAFNQGYAGELLP